MQLSRAGCFAFACLSSRSTSHRSSIKRPTRNTPKAGTRCLVNPGMTTACAYCTPSTSSGQPCWKSGKLWDDLFSVVVVVVGIYRAFFDLKYAIYGA